MPRGRELGGDARPGRTSSAGAQDAGRHSLASSAGSRVCAQQGRALLPGPGSSFWGMSQSHPRHNSESELAGGCRRPASPSQLTVGKDTGRLDGTRSQSREERWAQRRKGRYLSQAPMGTRPGLVAPGMGPSAMDQPPASVSTAGSRERRGCLQAAWAEQCPPSA